MEGRTIKKEIIEYLKIINFFSKKFDINSYISKNKSINDENELLKLYEDVKKEANKILIDKCKELFKNLIFSISSLVRNKSIDDKEKLTLLNNIMDKISRIEEIDSNPYEALYRNVYIRHFLITNFNGNKENFLESYPSLAGFVEIYEKEVEERDQNKAEIKAENAKYHEKNKELMDRYLAGDTSVKEELVTTNMKLVQKIANGYRAKNGFKFPVDELINEGVTGLMTAIERYNPKIGQSFSQYATFWIKQKISYFVKANYRITHIPINKVASFMEIKKKLAQIESEYGPNLPIDQIIELLGITIDEYNEYLLFSDEDLSLEAKTSNARHDETTSTTVGHFMPSHTNVEKEIVDKVSEEQLLERMKEILTPREYVIIYNRFGFGGTEVKTQERIAADLKITRQRVNQVEMDALKKIQYLLEGKTKDLNKLIKRKEHKSKPKEKKKRKILSWFNPLV